MSSNSLVEEAASPVPSRWTKLQTDALRQIAEFAQLSDESIAHQEEYAFQQCNSCVVPIFDTGFSGHLITGIEQAKRAG